MERESGCSAFVLSVTSLILVKPESSKRYILALGLRGINITWYQNKASNFGSG